MTTAKRFEDLEVWQKSKELTNLIYQLSPSGTFARDFGLRDQMRRAAVSIMSNTLEQKYITDEEFNSASSLAEVCSKQLARLIQYLETQPNTRRVREGEITYDIQP